MVQEFWIHILTRLVFWFLEIMLPAYIIYLISTFFHEHNHMNKAVKHNVKILKTKKEHIEAGQEKDLLKCSLFILGMQISFFSGRITPKTGEIEALKDLKKQKEILLAGIKSDLTFMFILASIYALLSLSNFAGFTNIINNEINGIFSLSLLFILTKTFDNIFDPFHKGGDLRKLLELKHQAEKT